MKPRLFSTATIAAFLLATTTVAQDPGDAGGAGFLLLPVGARAVGMGQAVAGEALGSESVWWNPSALARLDKREAAIHHSQTVIATGDALTLVLPSKTRGALALSINILNFGDQQVTDEQGPIGVILPRNVVFAGTYARMFGTRLNAGVTYKLIQFRVDCSGQCSSVATFAAKSSAADAGAQYHIGGRHGVTLGASVRNVGSRLRVADRAEADRLPTRIDVGASHQLLVLERYISDMELRLGAGLVGDRSFNDLATRIGGDLVWQKRVHLRGGFASREADGSGAAIGVGIVAGQLEFDIARSFGGLSSDAGQPPTYFSLRYLF